LEKEQSAGFSPVKTIGGGGGERQRKKREDKRRPLLLIIVHEADGKKGEKGKGEKHLYYILADYTEKEESKGRKQEKRWVFSMSREYIKKGKEEREKRLGVVTYHKQREGWGNQKRAQAKEEKKNPLYILTFPGPETQKEKEGNGNNATTRCA